MIMKKKHTHLYLKLAEDILCALKSRENIGSDQHINKSDLILK